ncbi:hypothetical protein RGQ29_011183 [Quercus rubra]|uniref:GRF-type domain-containing protein n=1 Tax=Quercus rubra TaxID=3512 RepID=A0AAN7G2S9_QUERU|nr:hypothetical protein RGQ29_011183 [Quercus rubra]
MEASCSTGSNVKRRAPMRCYCNKKPIIVVSWISDNPGRRFYGCPNYWVGGKCRFFQWYDDEICARGKVLTQSKGRGSSHLRLRLQAARRGRSF